MAPNVKVIHHSDFIRARPDGAVDLDAGERLLEKIASLAEPLDDFEVLIDLRNITGMLQVDDLLRLAASLERYEGTFLRKTALLCPPERFENARAFALMAANQGFTRIKAFVEYEAAVQWLIAPPG